MHTRTLNSVREILLPFSGELPLEPSVRLNDQITTAIEIMVKHNLQLIPVIWNTRPVGQVRLKDAFASVIMGTVMIIVLWMAIIVAAVNFSSKMVPWRSFIPIEVQRLLHVDLPCSPAETPSAPLPPLH